MTFSLFFPTDILEFTQGDTRPVLNFQITDDQDPPQPINLAGISVFFTLKKNQDTAFKFKRECFHIDDPTGFVGFNWEEGDLDIAGRYKGEIELDFPDGTIQSQLTPFDIKVRPQLDETPGTPPPPPPAPPPVMICPTITLNNVLPHGSVGNAYIGLITATTGPYTFTLDSGTLPEGVTLSPDGRLTGVPVEEGTYTFVVKATDASDCTGFNSFALVITTIAPPPSTT